jgi:malonate decarboxylase beta subunit
MRTWDEIQQEKFSEANARERAMGMVDKGTFTELLGPKIRMTSPHLPLLGEAVSFDDGIVTGLGMVDKRPIFFISQEPRFIGGAIGEVSGAKMVGAMKLALNSYEKIKKYYPDSYHQRLPAIVISFDTGGVRLHEANAGLLAHAEIMDLLQDARGKVPVISIIGGKVGCFGGMGFVAAATDVIIMNERGRLGLTGPEVIEQEIGKAEYDASDRALIYRTTGGKHKYIMHDCNFLIDDNLEAFRKQLRQVLRVPIEMLSKYRRIGTLDLAQEQLCLVSRSTEMSVLDSMDLWKTYGNKNPQSLPDMQMDQFLAVVKRRSREDSREDCHGR